MRKLSYLLFVLTAISVSGQIGINTQTPETTLEIVGKPNDINHYDGVIPPRLTGNQLALKTYSTAKKRSCSICDISACQFIRTSHSNN